ncbi:hypothetical protein AAD001_09880 [Colwelliaceae bacterium 6471]
MDKDSSQRITLLSEKIFSHSASLHEMKEFNRLLDELFNPADKKFGSSFANFEDS